MADQSKNKWFPWRRLLRSTQTPRPETREVAVSQVTDKYSEYPSDGLTPVRLAMDPASFPVAAKDMAALRGRDVGAPYRPSLPTPEGPAKEGFRRTMSEAGLI